MTDVTFVPGQRWISNTEADLGLGIVLELENRRVTLSFPAAGEHRTYAQDNAPISRVYYQVGDQVSDLDGNSMCITEVQQEQGCYIYTGLDSAGQPLQLLELELDSFVQFSTPRDRLFSGQIDRLSSFKLRTQTLAQLRRHQQSLSCGLLGARVQLLPHQLYIASEVANRHAPRVLLADEVGLGKTIEAGLILHQQLISGRASRAIIVVPDSLVHQWLVEMLRRFNLQFTLLDEERCLALQAQEEDAFELDENDQPIPLQASDENPFETTQLVLCSLSFLSENPLRQQQALAADWDLLLVDEAHHLVWDEQQPSKEYRCIEALAAVASGLLLLTATPEQLGIESHFARLRLLDPDRYFDLEAFKREEEGYQPVNQLVGELLALRDGQGEAESLQALAPKLADYLDAGSLAQFTARIEAGELAAAVESVTAAILDRHGTGRVLFRNTRSAVKGFPERQLLEHPLTMPDDYALQLAGAPLLDYLRPESLLGPQWVLEDSRVTWLVDWLKQHRREKVLLICADAETALDLEEYLRLRKGVVSAVFHEGLSLIARDRAAAYFADSEEGAQLLICSEIGSEGRNFQFAHHLVLFDLPLNPDLLEQRIGRLDRIGQTQTVKIHVPHYADSAQAVLLRWYHAGINAFLSASPAGKALYDQFAESLHNCMQAPGDDGQLADLVEQTRASYEQTEARLQQGRDRLLELNSCQPHKAQRVIDAICEEERSEELSAYMELVFDQFGVDQEPHSAHSSVLHPSDHMHAAHFPGLSDAGVTVTYQRELALQREDIQFLTWEHPMVSGAMDMVLSGELGNTAMGTIKLPPLKAGTLMVEAIFTLKCPAPAQLQLGRYLPQTSVRSLIDTDKRNLGKILTGEKLDKLIQKVPRASAQELVKHARSQLGELLDHAEQQVAPQQQLLVDEATESMQQSQGAEIRRLEALAQVNPNIRKQEIDFLQQQTDSLHHYLQGAKLSLGAVRVIMAV